jgi:glycosyltransferase involved in cell wall biosynthesis
MEDSRMDVAIVTTRMIGMDAISNFTMASAAAFAGGGKAVVFTFACERPPADGVDIRFLGGRNAHSIGTSLRALLGTFGLARELSKYDVLIMVNPDVGSMPACHLAKRYSPKLKAMWTFHGLTPLEYITGARDRWLMMARRLAYIRSMIRTPLIKVDSGFVRSELALSGVDTSRVVVMPLGADMSRMGGGNGRKVRESYGIGDRFLLLYVGRLVEFKHVDELIRAVAGIDGACLLVVGGGPDRERLERLAAELRLEDRVKLAGIISDGELPDYYAACDAWATASRHEGFCVPIIEAMAAGKPVIVPDVAAAPETAGDAGLTYRSGNIAELAEKIRSLAGDKALYADLAGRAKARAASFEMRGVIGRYVRLVEEYYGGASWKR